MKHKKQDKDHKEEELLEEALAEDAGASEKEETEPEPEEDKAKAPRAVPDSMEGDIALFHDLFPEVKAEDIPQEVWDRVEKGESLASSFSLFRMQQQKEAERIEKVNRENEEKAPPKIRHDGKEFTYFSPEAVKAMTRSEIKKNYDAILASMEKWN